MPVRGIVSHIDLNVSDPSRSIPFYARVLEYLGMQRFWVNPPDGRVAPEDATRSDRCAWWALYHGGAVFGLEIRPPAFDPPRQVHERYSPGLDHLAFHASSREDVNGLYALLQSAEVPVSDPPREYPEYSPGYYAVAFDDPDGIKLEVVYEPGTNPA